jgi:hypothetical protein
LDDGAPNPSGGVEAENTGGLRGGVATAAGGEGWEVLLGVLHDEEKMRSASRYDYMRMGRGTLGAGLTV